MHPLILTSRIAAVFLNAAYMVWLFPEIIYSYTHRIEPSATANDHRSGAVLVICILIGIFMAYALAGVEILFSIFWQPTIVFALGILLMVVGVTFRWYAIRVLGKYFTLRLAIQPGQTVVEDGPYRWIRHPSYTGSLITMFGLGLAFTNWLSLLAVLAAGFIGYSYRVMIEERILVAALGDPYREYMKHTKRFIPFVY